MRTRRSTSLGVSMILAAWMEVWVMRLIVETGNTALLTFMRQGNCQWIQDFIGYP